MVTNEQKNATTTTTTMNDRRTSFVADTLPIDLEVLRMADVTLLKFVCIIYSILDSTFSTIRIIRMHPAIAYDFPVDSKVNFV